MGRTNQETWNQPPVSLNVEWPLDCSKRSGPTLEEQKARMRETRARLANAIAASGHPVPNWPEVGQSVNWSLSRHTFLGEGPVNFRGQANRPPSWRIPLRYQTSVPVATPLTPNRRGRGIVGQTTSSLQGSPLSPFPTRPRSKSHQSPAENFGLVKNMMDAARTPSQYPNTKPLGPLMTSRAHNGLPVDIDPSIFHPQIFVVELPDRVFQRTPPIAPRAMLEQMSSMNVPRQFNRARMDSGATASTSHRSYETARSRARGCSATTMGSHHSFEPNLPDDNDCTEPEESFKTTLSHVSPLTPPSAAKEYSSTSMNTTTNHQGIDPRESPASEVEHSYKLAQSITPPPGFERHLATNPSTYIPPPLSFENSVVDFIDTTGTWSYSKIWVSEEERLRINFARMQEKAHHTSLDKSPFFPQNVSEYVALLAEKKAAEAERIRKRIQHNEETVHSRHDAVVKEIATPRAPQFQLFWGRKMSDGLSAVLAMETCFNEIPDTPEHERVDWPPTSEFRSWKVSRPPPGTRSRRDSHRGAWPFPRLNMPFQADEAFDDGGIPYSKRKMVFAPRWDWAPKLVWMKDEEVQMPVCEISVTWLFSANPMLADLLEDIQRLPPQERMVD